MDEQGGVDGFGVDARKEFQLPLQIDAQFAGAGRFGNDIANLLPGVHRLGERTEVQTDDRAYQPALGRGHRR